MSSQPEVHSLRPPAPRLRRSGKPRVSLRDEHGDTDGFRFSLEDERGDAYPSPYTGHSARLTSSSFHIPFAPASDLVMAPPLVQTHACLRSVKVLVVRKRVVVVIPHGRSPGVSSALGAASKLLLERTYAMRD